MSYYGKYEFDLSLFILNPNPQKNMLSLCHIQYLTLSLLQKLRICLVNILKNNFEK